MGATPSGTRGIVPVTGGTCTGPHLQGMLLPGGGGWALLRPDGVTVLNVRVTLRMDDDQLIYRTYRGLYIVSPESKNVRRGYNATEILPTDYSTHNHRGQWHLGLVTPVRPRDPRSSGV